MLLFTTASGLTALFVLSLSDVVLVPGRVMLFKLFATCSTCLHNCAREDLWSFVDRIARSVTSSAPRFLSCCGVAQL